MEIPEIKSKLTIAQVLAHYNLQADKNSRLCCPFHADKTPSMQVYTNTNTYTCFSSNCKAGSGDVIDFIGHWEKCNKHQALLKATELAGGNVVAIVNDSEARLALLSRAYQFYQNAYKQTEPVKWRESVPVNGVKVYQFLSE